jgi:hypothetical protein
MSVSPSTQALRRNFYGGNLDSAERAFLESAYASGVNASSLIRLVGSFKNQSLQPANCIAATMDRATTPLTSASAPTSGTLQLFAIELVKGQVITNVAFATGSTGATAPTNYWFAIYGSDLSFKARTADQLTAAWGANTARILALTSTWTVPSSGLYYVGFLMAASAMPTLIGISPNSNSQGSGNWAPIISGTSTTGMTAPTGAAAGALTTSGLRAYAWLT